MWQLLDSTEIINCSGPFHPQGASEEVCLLTYLTHQLWMKWVKCSYHGLFSYTSIANI